jgi:hypothetical protein
MEKRLALFDENDKFVLVSDRPQFALDYLRNVLGTGTMLRATRFTDEQLKTIPLDQLAVMAEKYNAERVKNV